MHGNASVTTEKPCLLGVSRFVSALRWLVFLIVPLFLFLLSAKKKTCPNLGLLIHLTYEGKNKDPSSSN